MINAAFWAAVRVMPVRPSLGSTSFQLSSITKVAEVGFFGDCLFRVGSVGGSRGEGISFFVVVLSLGFGFGRFCTLFCVPIVVFSWGCGASVVSLTGRKESILSKVISKPITRVGAKTMSFAPRSAI